MLVRIRISVIGGKMKNSAGFTLIELMVVMALVSLIIGIVSVLYGGGAEGRRLHSAGVALMATLRQARNDAERGQDQTFVTFDRNIGAYSYQEKTIPLPPGVEIDVRVKNNSQPNEKMQVVFSPGGYAAGVDITLKTSSSRAVIIRIENIIGSLSIENAHL